VSGIFNNWREFVRRLADAHGELVRVNVSLAVKIYGNDIDKRGSM
jgi:hypothetical protein